MPELRPVPALCCTGSSYIHFNTLWALRKRCSAPVLRTRLDNGHHFLSRPMVRFHAAQSIVTFGGLHILRMVLGMPFGVGWWFGGFGHWGGFGIGVVLLSFLGLLTFVLWIICMVKAYQGVRFKLPLAGDIAENIADR